GALMPATRRPARRKSTRAKTTTRAARQSPAVKSVAAADAASAGGKARTIIFVHGIGNKPLPETLKCQWDNALFGFNLGERSRLAYWVNRVFYPEPVKASCQTPDATVDAAHAEGGVAARAVGDAAEGVEPLLPADATRHQRAVLERIAAKT